MIIAPENSKYKDNFIKIKQGVYYSELNNFFLETDGGDDEYILTNGMKISKSDMVDGPDRLIIDGWYIFIRDLDPSLTYMRVAYIAADKFLKEDTK